MCARVRILCGDVMIMVMMEEEEEDEHEKKREKNEFIKRFYYIIWQIHFTLSTFIPCTHTHSDVIEQTNDAIERVLNQYYWERVCVGAWTYLW